MQKTVAQKDREAIANEVAVHFQQLTKLYEERGDRAIFTKEVIKYNADQLASLTDEKRVCNLKDFDGVIHYNVNPYQPSSGSYDIKQARLCFLELVQTASSFTPGAYESVFQERLEPRAEVLLAKVYMRLLPSSYWDPLVSKPKDRKQCLVLHAKLWEDSKLRNKFKDSLSLAWKQTSPPENIKNIVCFGLRELYVGSYNEHPDDLRRLDAGLDRFRTLLAFDIARLLRTDFNITVPLVFHDSEYEDQDRKWILDLAAEWNVQISFLDICQALLKVDGNTLVLAHGGPGLPIRSIILDITREEGGPAGFFCEDITVIKTIEEEAKASRSWRGFDHPTKRMSEMAEDYEMDDVCKIDQWKVTMYLKRHAIKEPPREGLAGRVLALFT